MEALEDAQRLQNNPIISDEDVLFTSELSTEQQEGPCATVAVNNNPGSDAAVKRTTSIVVDSNTVIEKAVSTRAMDDDDDWADASVDDDTMNAPAASSKPPHAVVALNNAAPAEKPRVKLRKGKKVPRDAAKRRDKHVGSPKLSAQAIAHKAELRSLRNELCTAREAAQLKKAECEQQEVLTRCDSSVLL